MQRIFAPLVALLALAAIGLALYRLAAPMAELHIRPLPGAGAPALVFTRASGADGPAVVLAHGFAGSQQMMQPMAVMLARAGYTAVTFDFPGHGRNPAPLAGGLGDDATASAGLMAALEAVVQAARPLGDGRVALLGHSMGADIVTRYALDRPEIAATIALSLYAPSVTPERPRNLLAVTGAWEPAFLTDEARRLASQAASGEAAERTTYGDPAAGTARRYALAAGVEHIGVIWSVDAQAEANGWLNLVFGRNGQGAVDRRGPSFALLFGGLVALAWPLSRLLPRCAPPQGAGLGWRRLWPVLVLPAIATPVLLWPLPKGLLPLLLGDYIAAHMALYGALTAAALWWRGAARPAGIAWGRLALAAAAIGLYAVLGFGLPVELYLTSFWPPPHRLVLAPALLAGTLPFFLADEWATRGPGSPWLAATASKLAFFASLLGAVALDPPRLGFLVIIAPVMLLFLGLYGVFGAWAQRRTGVPFAAAIGHAVALALAMAATFPMVPG